MKEERIRAGLYIERLEKENAKLRRDKDELQKDERLLRQELRSRYETIKEIGLRAYEAERSGEAKDKAIENRQKEIQDLSYKLDATRSLLAAEKEENGKLKNKLEHATAAQGYFVDRAQKEYDKTLELETDLKFAKTVNEAFTVRADVQEKEIRDKAEEIGKLKWNLEYAREKAKAPTRAQQHRFKRIALKVLKHSILGHLDKAEISKETCMFRGNIRRVENGTAYIEALRFVLRKIDEMNGMYDAE